MLQSTHANQGTRDESPRCAPCGRTSNPLQVRPRSLKISRVGLPLTQGLACCPRLLVAAYLENKGGDSESASWCICDLLFRSAESCSRALASLFAALTWLGLGLGLGLGSGSGSGSGSGLGFGFGLKLGLGLGLGLASLFAALTRSSRISLAVILSPSAFEFAALL